MSTELEVAAPGGGVLPAYANLADRISKTEFVPKGLRGRPEAVLACILYGHEVGMGPMQSLSSIDVIEGKPTVKPEAMRGLVRQAGHAIWVEERTAQAVTVAGRRREDPDHVERITWTLDDAKAAGLGQKDVWKKYPRAMLLARATSELCRSMFPDVIAGLSYTAEEVDFRNALEAAEVVEIATDDERAELEEGVAGLTDVQRAKLVEWWKHAGLGSLRTDAVAPLLADQVGEAWALVNEAAAVVDEVDDDGSPEQEGGNQGASGFAENDLPAPDFSHPGPALPDNPLSQRVNRQIFVLLRKAGMAELSDEERHQWASEVLGKPVGSFTELTADDGVPLVEWLEAKVDDVGRPFE